MIAGIFEDTPNIFDVVMIGPSYRRCGGRRSGTADADVINTDFSRRQVEPDNITVEGGRVEISHGHVRFEQTPEGGFHVFQELSS